MTNLTGPRALGIILATMCAGHAVAADPAPTDVAVDRDLTSVIALQGLPCGKVIKATQQGQDDFVAACEDGNRYRVYVGADGRVIVEKLN
jgi:hypothetical protein